MTDIDAVIRAAAADFRTDEAPFPDLDAAVRTASAAGATRRLRRWSVLGAAAAVLVVGTGAVAITHHGEDRRHRDAAVASAPADPQPVRSITVDGESVPYAGAVPWSGAVLDATNPRVIHVQADGDDIRAADTCGLPDERIVLSQTSTSVRVLVAGYAAPLPSDVDCSTVGHSTQPQRIVLDEPLGHRTLVDVSDGASHAVLDPRNVPQAYSLPAGCVPRPLTWDEKSGLAIRSCLRGNQNPHTHSLSLELEVGADGASAADHGAPAGLESGPYPVGSAPARLWLDTSNVDYVWTLQWSPHAGRQLTLTIGYDPADRLTRDQVLAIAQSVR